MFTTSLCHPKQATKLVGFNSENMLIAEKAKGNQAKKKEHEQQTVDMAHQDFQSGMVAQQHCAAWPGARALILHTPPPHNEKWVPGGLFLKK
jgi:hypothetical protein